MTFSLSPLVCWFADNFDINTLHLRQPVDIRPAAEVRFLTKHSVGQRAGSLAVSRRVGEKCAIHDQLSFAPEYLTSWQLELLQYSSQMPY